MRSTASALAGAAGLGNDFEEMLEIITSLTTADFYKSMTTHSDHRVWQNVYRPRTSAGEVYVKVPVVAEVLTDRVI